MDSNDKDNISPNNNNSSSDIASDTRKSTHKTFKRAFLSDEQSHMQNESKLNNNIDNYYEFGDSDESDDGGIEVDENSSSSESDEELQAVSVITKNHECRGVSTETNCSGER